MYFILIIIGVLILDQGTKFLVQQTMLEGQSIPVVDSFFKLTYVKNPGAAFGILPNKTYFFIAVTFLVIFLVIVFYKKIAQENRFLRMGLALQVGGAIGNLLDRMRLGRVTDFFELPHWPVFNIADMAIVVGVGLLILELLRTPKQKEA